MRSMRGSLVVVLAVLLTTGAGSFAARADEDDSAGADPSITVRMGNSAWTYSHEQLLAMATTSIPNLRRTKQKKALPLASLLFKDTGLRLDQVDTIFVIPKSGMVTILKGKDLAHVEQLVLATGVDKHGSSHPWAMAAASPQAYEALKRTMGSPRKHKIERIDIVPKQSAESN
ncbi:MAG: hypothetical protein ACE5FL_02245 [Myxococcota bacterium]